MLHTTAENLTSEQSETFSEMLEAPSDQEIRRAHDFIFGRGGFPFTSTALLAMAKAYEQECSGDDGEPPPEGLTEALTALRTCARTLALIEAQVI